VDIVRHYPDHERRWRVQRHYVALHGITAKDLPNLGFPEIEP
jgi:hypothetical protein